MRRWIAIAVLVILATNVGLYASGQRILVNQSSIPGWLVEGDMEFRRDDPAAAAFREKKPIQITKCVYWTGLGLQKNQLDGSLLPKGCP